MSEVFHYAGGPLNNAGDPRVIGHDPQGRSYYSFASFEDPDGNGWPLQEIQTLPAARNLTRPQTMDVATLAGLLRETAEHHDHFRRRTPNITGGTRMPYSSQAAECSNPEEAKPPPIATWKRSFTFFPRCRSSRPLFTSLRTMFKCIKIPNLRNVGQTQSYESVAESCGFLAISLILPMNWIISVINPAVWLSVSTTN